MRRFVKHKFNAKPVKDDGHHFSSKLEHRYFNNLKLLQKAGDVLFFLRQVPIALPGGTKYVCDFLVFYADGNVEFVEVKGIMTSMASLKIKQSEDIYPIKIKVIKDGDF